MEGAGRIFAGEFARARHSRSTIAGEPPALLTPCGMVCSLLFVAGTLTEKEQQGTEKFYGRVADPTGVFEIRKIRPDSGLQAAISGIAVPSFVTIMGQARAHPDSGNPAPYIELIEMREIDRPTRDAWIVRTATITSNRLMILRKALETGYGSDAVIHAISEFGTSSLTFYTEMVGRAIAQVAETPTKGGVDSGVKEKVLALIREKAGKKGIPLDDLIGQAAESGIDDSMVRRVVKTLLEEDECYQPAREVLKPL